MCYKEIGLCAQQIDAILGSIVESDNWEGLYDRESPL